jgi:hypothetical protein
MQPFRDLVRSGLRRGFAAFPGQDKLQMAWTIACGKALAQRGSVVGYDQAGIVEIEVLDRVWLNEMENMRDHLKAELTRMTGLPIAELHFIVKR